MMLSTHSSSGLGHYWLPDFAVDPERWYSSWTEVTNQELRKSYWKDYHMLWNIHEGKAKTSSILAINQWLSMLYPHGTRSRSRLHGDHTDHLRNHDAAEWMHRTFSPWDWVYADNDRGIWFASEDMLVLYKLTWQVESA